MLADVLSTWLIGGVLEMLEMPEVSGSRVRADCLTCSVVLVLQVSELETCHSDFQAIPTAQKLNTENHWGLAWAFAREAGVRCSACS